MHHMVYALPLAPPSPDLSVPFRVSWPFHPKAWSSALCDSKILWRGLCSFSYPDMGPADAEIFTRAFMNSALPKEAMKKLNGEG